METGKVEHKGPGPDACLAEYLYLWFQTDPDGGLKIWRREFDQSVTDWQFDRSQRLLRDIRRFSVVHKEHIEQFHVCAGRLATELWQWERAGDIFARLADQAYDGPAQGEYLLNLADTLRLRGRLTDALEHYRKSLELLRQGSPATKIMYNLHMTGVTYWSLERFDEALRCYQQSLAGYEELAQSTTNVPSVNRHIANIKRDMAHVYRKLGRLTEAVDLLQESLTILEVSDEPFLIGLTLLAFGKVLHAQNQWNTAGDYYRQSLSIFESVGTALFQTEALYRLCQLCLDQKDPITALAYAQDVQEIALQHGFHDWIARALQIVGDIVLSQKELNNASMAFAQACTYALEYNPALFERICSYISGKIAELWAQGHVEQAMALHDGVTPLLEESGIAREKFGKLIHICDRQPTN